MAPRSGAAVPRGGGRRAAEPGSGRRDAGGAGQLCRQRSGTRDAAHAPPADEPWLGEAGSLCGAAQVQLERIWALLLPVLGGPVAAAAL
ncbi:hypothetical protein ACFQFR_16575 [Streptomyces goshikiensis]